MYLSPLFCVCSIYALQSIYSADFETASQQMVFFYVPFSLLFSLLRRMQWTPRLLRSCLLLVAGLAVLFAAIGFGEYATKTLLLNPKLIAANNVHTYFTVNSVFFDPDIFGRFLALVMIVLAAALLYDEDVARAGREHGDHRDPLGWPRAHAFAVEPRGAAGRARDPLGAALEGVAR